MTLILLGFYRGHGQPLLQGTHAVFLPSLTCVLPQPQS